MSRPHSRSRFRDHFLPPRHEPHFRWRGREVSRLEGFADAVFAFAVTLLIVALEVPHTFGQLLDALRGFPAFTACFLILMIFWNAHYRFFRRYGMEDRFTRIISTLILLLVLFCVYPLKFLFGMLLNFGVSTAPHVSTLAELKAIYIIYGLGFVSIWIFYAALYMHAWRQRQALGLNYAELLQTREPLIGFSINIAICLVSISLAMFTQSPWMPGYLYFLLGPLLTVNGLWHGRKVRAWYRRQTHLPGAA